jgi:hypothetical protein
MREFYLGFVYLVAYIFAWLAIAGRTGPETIVACAVLYPLFRGGLWALRLFLEGFFAALGVRASGLFKAPKKGTME